MENNTFDVWTDNDRRLSELHETRLSYEPSLDFSHPEPVEVEIFTFTSESMYAK